MKGEGREMKGVAKAVRVYFILPPPPFILQANGVSHEC
jgi:hypothetical protein